ncbi:MAG: NAD-dependent epimerase/dehydratase family protein [Panacagrimonas sp.]
MKGALLIGGAGFIGRNLQDELERRGYRILVADLSVAANSHRQVRLAVSQTEELTHLLKDASLDVVIHLASGLLPASEGSAFAREQDLIVRPSLELMATCARLGKRFVLFSSGGTVYGEGGATPIAEDRPVDPTSCYARSKVLLEQAVREAHARDGLEYLILRPSNPYGRYQRIDGPQGLIAVAIGKGLGGQTLKIRGDGNAVRDYIDVRDLASAAVDLAAGAAVNRTLNVSSGVGQSVEAVIATVERVLGRQIARACTPPRSSDLQSVILDPRALAALVPWAPRPLDRGVQEFYDDIRSGQHA